MNSHSLELKLGQINSTLYIILVDPDVTRFSISSTDFAGWQHCPMTGNKIVTKIIYLSVYSLHQLICRGLKYLLKLP